MKHGSQETTEMCSARKNARNEIYQIPSKLELLEPFTYLLHATSSLTQNDPLTPELNMLKGC